MSAEHVQMLMDMGFPKEKAEKALRLTDNKGVEQAMEWLLSHPDDEMEETLEMSVKITPAKPEESSADPAAPSQSEDATASGSSKPDEAKSLKCDDCGRLFKTQLEVEFHAAKSGHSNFSESTEEKKPLTEEEKKEQLAKLEEKMRKKRLEREETEKQEALEKERLRIKSGKDMSEARKRQEEDEMKKIVEQRKREKMEEKIARDRVRAQIESDKAARRAKAEAQSGASSSAAPVTVSPPQPQQPAVSTTTTPKNYKQTKIQIRLLNGSTLVETFDVKEQLSAVRLFIQLKQGDSETPFGLMTNFPKKVFTDEDWNQQLETLGLVPSAVLIVTRSQMA